MHLSWPARPRQKRRQHIADPVLPTRAFQPGHQNIAAVASLIGLSAVIVAGDAPIEEDTLKKAEQNDVLILATSLPAYDVIGKLYELGIRNVK